MHEHTPIAVGADPGGLAADLESLRAHVERLDSVVELQREYIGRLRTFLLAFGDRRPDGRLIRVPDMPEPIVVPFRSRGRVATEVDDDAVAS